MKEQKKQPPTREMIRKWVERDLKASLGFLHFINNTPGLLDKIANEIYDTSNSGLPKIDNNARTS